MQPGAASVYQLPYADGSFDAAFACAVLQHLAVPLAALKEMRRVLKPGGVIGIVDGSSTITFRYPTNALLERWDTLRGLERGHNTGRPSDALRLRALLREAGVARTEASGTLATEAGPPAGSLEETRRVAQNHLIRLRGVLGELAVTQGWATRQELEQIAEALMAWGESVPNNLATEQLQAITKIVWATSSVDTAQESFNTTASVTYLNVWASTFDDTINHGSQIGATDNTWTIDMRAVLPVPIVAIQFSENPVNARSTQSVARTVVLANEALVDTRVYLTIPGCI